MASATGVPPEVPRAAEDEPLLGRAGDASQQDGRPLQFNLLLGTAVIAQVGIWILVATVWASVFIHPPFTVFTPHPLLNSIGILLTVEAILILQPTHTSKQKHTGAHIHGILNSLSILCLLLAFIFIEINKFKGGAAHFTSIHGRLGLFTYIVLFIQAIVGILQFYVPQAFGGEVNAKKIYKYHRMSGYVILVLSLASVCAATQTGFNMSTFHIQLWAMLVTSVIVLAGVGARVKKGKLGL